MATFQYDGLTSGDRLMTGTIEAGSQAEAAQLLEQMQLKVNSLELSKPQKPKTAIGRTEFMLFNQQLASITKTGIPLERALRELCDDIVSRPMRKLIKEITDDLESGTDIVEAFEKREKSFPPLYGRILKAGIETGRLSEMLTSLNRNLEVANQTRRIVFEAITYPAVILVISIIIITGVLLFIVPGFETVLTEMVEGRLNPITEFFFLVSRNVLGVWIFLGGFVASLVFIYIWLSTFAAGRRFKESFYLKVPIFGRLYHSSILSKMAESMAMMVAAGADMPTILRLSSQASGSEKLILEGDILATEVEQGTNIVQAGQFCKVLPRLFMYSIQLSGQRNELQDNLYNMGQMYSEQVRCWQMRLQSILLPVMLLFIGVFLFMTMAAIFLPMVQGISGLGGGV